MNGTYSEGLNQIDEVPCFKFERKKSKRPNLRKENTSSTNVKNQQMKKEEASQSNNCSFHKSVLDDRGPFENYGSGNTNPTNPNLYMTTFNVKASGGINPHIVMKSKIRNNVNSKYARSNGYHPNP